MIEFKIDKDVSYPEYGDHPLRKYPFHKMEVGDSFEVSSDLWRKIKNASWQYGNDHSKKFSVRKTATGYRCWRIA